MDKQNHSEPFRNGKVPIWSWRHAIMKSGASSGTRHVCHVIACDLSDTGKFTRLTVAELSAATGISDRSISRHIAEAEAAGLLKVKRIRDSDGYVIGTHYYPRFPDHMELAKETAKEAGETLPANLADRAEEARETLPAKMADRAKMAEYAANLPAKIDMPSSQIGGHTKETFPTTLPIEEKARARPAANDAPCADRRVEIGSAMKGLARSLRANSIGTGGR